MLSSFIIFFKMLFILGCMKENRGKTISVETVLLGSPSGVLGDVFRSRGEVFYGPAPKENPCLILKR